MVKPTLQSRKEASPLTSKSTTISLQHSLLEIFCNSSTKIPVLAPAPAFATENPSESPNFDRIWPFQVRRIHLDTFLQYFPNCPANTFLHQHMVQSRRKNGVGQPLVSTTVYQSSARSDISFIERSALRVAHSWPKRGSQKLMLECQNYMKSQRSK